MVLQGYTTIPPSEPEAENLSIPYAHSHISFNFRTIQIFQTTANNCKATSAMAFAEINEENIKDLLSTKDRIYTNHSIRAMIITEMGEAGIDKSESSIKHYAQRLSEKKKREKSDCFIT